MSKVAFIDFETYSEGPIQTLGASGYASHSTTEVLCLAIKITGGQATLWLPGSAMPAELKDIVYDGGELHAHNAYFERMIWKHVMVVQHGWPEVKLSQWHCTAARCAALALPRGLDKAATALGLTEKKDKVGHRLMLKYCKPRKPSKHNKAERFSDTGELNKIYAYCGQDVQVEMAVHKATPPLQERNRLTWLLDQKINDRGIPVDAEFLRDVIETEKLLKVGLLKEFKELTQNQVGTPNQLVAFVQWLAENGCNMGTLGKDEVEGMLATDLSPKCRRALEIRQATSRSSTKKYGAMLARMEADGRIRGEHLFHGASTGRFAGTGVQIQNLPRPAHKFDDVLLAIEAFASRDPELIRVLYDDPAGIAVSCVRSAIRAEAGKRFLVCDFEGIESRVLGWLAGDDGYQSIFAAGEDIYVDMAKHIYGTDKINDEKRQLGKVAILGLGFGMGWKKFIETAGKWGIEIDEQTSRTVVNTYRDTYGEIKSWWYALDDAAKLSVTSGQVTSAGSVRFYVAGRFLHMMLPSGRKLSYFDPVVKLEDTPVGRKPQLSYMGVNSVNKQWCRKRTYGGKLCENAVQATALDVMVDAMFRAEKQEYEIIFHIHDEIVCEVRDGFGSISELEEIMSVVPSWATGAFIGAKGAETQRYRKV